MGCCISTKSPPNNTSHKIHEHETRSAPPSLDELEETVKEVLSVTAATQLDTVQIRENIVQAQQPSEEYPCYNHLVEDSKKKKETTLRYNEEMISETEKETSETCSFTVSESFSTNFHDDDDINEVKQQVMFTKTPPPLGPKSANSSRVIAAGKSPNRRSDQSPVKRTMSRGSSSVRSLQGRDPGRVMRLDPNGNSGRRSRSPATNRSVTCRSPSNRRVIGSPGRVMKDPDENRRGGGVLKRQCEISSTDMNGHLSESLENPLVSLECFIFL